ncbi:MAG: hypothetical protein ACYC3K_05980 [Candidatus Nanopelagicales bacterium]
MDSAGCQDQVVAAVHALAADPATAWAPALGRQTDAASEIAQTTTTLLGRRLRLIVRRQPRAPPPNGSPSMAGTGGGCTRSSPTSTRLG